MAGRTAVDKRRATIANRDQLPNNGSQSNDEYERRREIVNVQYGVHPLLPTMEHARTGKGESGRYIALPKLLDFAKEVGWRGTRDFENGLSRSTVHLPGGQIVEVEQEVDDLPKGERYMLVRMGALVTIFERCLNPSQSINRQKFLSGDMLNLSALGQELEEVIATAANEAKRSTVVRFSKEANRKQLAAAKKALKQFF